jgi:hypothetical protein
VAELTFIRGELPETVRPVRRPLSPRDPRVWRTGLAECRAALADPAAYRAAAERREAIAAVKAALKPA